MTKFKFFAFLESNVGYCSICSKNVVPEIVLTNYFLMDRLNIRSAQLALVKRIR